MWQSEVLDALFQQGLDIAIEGEKPDGVEEKEWKRINRMACGTLRSCLSREQKYAFSKETSASKLWKALEEKFLKKSGQDKLYMKKRLFLFNYVPGTTMNDHITSFNQLVTDLMNMDVTFEDEDLALMLMGSLPDEFEYLETTLLHGKVYVSLSEVTAALYSYELRKKDKQENTRHWKKECPRLKNKGKPERGKAVSESNVVEYDDADSDFAFAATPSTSCSSLWLLDSACSHHMTPNREWESEKKHVYYFLGSTIVGTTAVAASTDEHESEATRLWHMRLGHVGEKSLKLLIDQGLLKGARTCKLAFCEHCIKGKKTRVKFGTTIHDTKGILDYVHSDVWGPSKITSLGGTHYYVTFVDDFSWRVWVYPMKTKDEVLGFFLKWKKMMETQTGRKIKRLRTDNGGEYKIDPFLKVCEEEGIVRHFTVRGFGLFLSPCQPLTIDCYWCKTPLENGLEYLLQIMIPYMCLVPLHTTMLRVKAGSKSKEGDLYGDHLWCEGYRLWCPETKKIIFSRDVTFDESTMLRKVTSEKLDQTDGTPKQVEFEGSKIVPTSKETNVDSPMVEEKSDEEEVQTQEPPQQHESIALREGKRTIRQPARYADMWRIAMNEEMQFLQKNQTWKLASLPKGKKAIGCKWVFAKKDGFPDKNNIRYKVRLMAKGYAQTEGVDYNEPDGFKVAEKEEMVCKLEKSLYGLKQSPRQWYKQFDKFMIGQKYTRSKYDHCVYLRELEDGSYIYLLLYVDDMLIASRSQTEIAKLKTQLNREFEMKDLGEAKKILGIEISRDKKLGRLFSTPLAPYFKLGASMSPKYDAEREYMSKVPYASAVGSLMYAMVCTRPDISQTVGLCWFGLSAGQTRQHQSVGSPPYSQQWLCLLQRQSIWQLQRLKEAIWLQGLLGELGMEQKHIKVHCDSQSAIHLAKNHVYHARTKHIDVRYHFVREILEEGGVIIQKIRTTENLADMLTKVYETSSHLHEIEIPNVNAIDGRKRIAKEWLGYEREIAVLSKASSFGNGNGDEEVVDILHGCLLRFGVEQCCSGQVGNPFLPDGGKRREMVPAMFVFGDSLIDNGNNNDLPSLQRLTISLMGSTSMAVLPVVSRMDIPWLTKLVTELLGLPLIPAFSEASGDQVLHGVNYASAASGILDITGRNFVSRIPFDQQIRNFQTTLDQITDNLGAIDAAEALAKCISLLGWEAMITSTTTLCLITPPKISTMVDNMLISWFKNTLSNSGYVNHFIHNLAYSYVTLYNLGARKFVVAGLGRMGCIPSIIAQSTADGCSEEVNQLVLPFNANVKTMMNSLNADLPGARFIYVDIAHLFEDIVVNAGTYGFSVVDRGCCGIGRNRGQITCLPFQTPCENRDGYVLGCIPSD
ncbi:GDSL esterase/lipase [Hibiscus syriacus]|uniref:GDSL esterase/lipase n=1 Tax=Hibiscus syriacus TaxID=106335 RepID=A0A6A2YYV0_HIBSY|nr:GDSL esterase/lipase [Hibiscus syriacus]